MYHYNGQTFESIQKVEAQIMIDHPELGDDAFVEFFENNVSED